MWESEVKAFFHLLNKNKLDLNLMLIWNLSLGRESTFGKMSYLQPMDTRQYLYCLKPKPEYAEKAGVIKGVTVIGKLDIVWKTNLGERGRLQTSQLQRMVPLTVLCLLFIYVLSTKGKAYDLCLCVCA